MESELSLVGVDFIKYYCELFKGKSVDVIDVYRSVTITGTYQSSDSITFSV